MRKILVICGPTATGKTKLAFHLAKLINGELISADSRQVYKYMDIGTGKEKPEGFQILGYDLVEPNDEFSVKNYIDFASPAIEGTYKDGKLPILVGGTGLYIKAVVDGIETASIAPSKVLRESLNKKAPDELFNLLTEINPEKAKSMNESDRKNPRRLVRAIEVASAKNNVGRIRSNFDSILFIGLTADGNVLKERIEKRVDERVRSGFEEEYNFLKDKGFLTGVASQTLGYKEWPDIKKWKIEEYKYAKRQMTWFKKDRRINWFDIAKHGWEEKVEQLVKKWYSLK